jgi:hypothetical protein
LVTGAKEQPAYKARVVAVVSKTKSEEQLTSHAKKREPYQCPLHSYSLDDGWQNEW